VKEEQREGDEVRGLYNRGKVLKMKKEEHE